MRQSDAFGGRGGLATVVALTVGWACLVGGVGPSRAQTAESRPPASAAAAVPEIGPAEHERLVRDLEEAYESVTVLARDLPRDSFDPQAVIEEIGRDPAALFAWVRDQTHHVPYQGSLRGPTGVIMDRLGNDLDRALLLAELFRSAGMSVRLARAPVSPEAAGQLAARVRAVPRERRSAALPQGQAGAARAGAREIIDQSATQCVRQAAALSAWVAPLRQPATAPAAGADIEAVAVALRQGHWWVQVQDGGKWIDFDPLLPDAEPGRPALVAAGAAAVTTLPPDARGEFSITPADCHEVEVRVVVERWAGGKLAEATVLAHTLRPSRLFGTRVELTHFPGGMLDGIRYGADPDAQAKFKQVVAAQAEWVPVLTVGRARVSQSGFTTTGRVIETPQLDPAGKLASGARRVTGGLLGGLEGDAPDAPDGGVLTAEWIEYVVRAPGRAPQTIRRRVFDLIGPAARAGGQVPATLAPDAPLLLNRGLALLGHTEVLVLPCDLSGDYVGRLMVDAELEASRAWLEVARRLREMPPDDAVRRLTTAVVAGRGVPVTPAHLYALHRQRLNPDRGSVYIDQPNLVNYRRFLQADATGALAMYELMDVVANPVAVVPGAGVDAFAARLRQGVADAEAELLALAPTGEPLRNTAGVFRTITEQGGGATPAPPPPLVIPADRAAASAPSLAALGVTPDVRARIDADLAAGYTVVVPSRPVVAENGHPALAWWRVDPRTGQAVGVCESGFHQALTEEQLDQTIPGTTPWRMTVREFGEIPTEAAFEYVYGRGAPKVLERLLQIRRVQELICRSIGRAMPPFFNGPIGPFI